MILSKYKSLFLGRNNAKNSPATFRGEIKTIEVNKFIILFYFG